MGKTYTEEDLRRIAESMIEYLKECENGTVTSTVRLAHRFGCEDMGTTDLFELHHALFRTAKANKITLDMSEHEGKEEGLPFSLTFVVRNKKT